MGLHFYLPTIIKTNIMIAPFNRGNKMKNKANCW